MAKTISLPYNLVDLHVDRKGGCRQQCMNTCSGIGGDGGLHLTWQTGRVIIRHGILAIIPALHAVNMAVLQTFPVFCQNHPGRREYIYWTRVTSRRVDMSHSFGTSLLWQRYLNRSGEMTGSYMVASARVAWDDSYACPRYISCSISIICENKRPQIIEGFTVLSLNI